MTLPAIVGQQLGGTVGLPQLIVGPSLGTPVVALWSAVAQRLARTHHTIGWDLPGHGGSPPPGTAFSIAELAEAVIDLVDATVGPAPFTYAGVSVAGAVGLQLLLDNPPQIGAAALISTGAIIGDPDTWASRADAVRVSGTESLRAQSARRWFAPGFRDRDPVTATALLNALSGVDDAGYARTCEALAGFDVRDRLAEIDTPVVAVAGAHDIATPPKSLRSISSGVVHGRYVEVPDAAHLIPAEQPDRIAALLSELTDGRPDDRQRL